MGSHRSWDIHCKIYVGGIRDDITKYDLSDAFSKFGPVRDSWVARKPPGFGFVEMEDARDAEDAAKALDGTKICGSRVRVEMSHGGSKRRGGGGRGGRSRSRERYRSRSRDRYRSRSRDRVRRRSPSYRSVSRGRGRRSPSNRSVSRDRRRSPSYSNRDRRKASSPSRSRSPNERKRSRSKSRSMSRS